MTVKIALATALLMASAAGAWADDDILQMTAVKSNGAPLSHDKMYGISVSCAPGIKPLPKPETGIFVWTRKTMSHFVIVSPTPPTPSTTPVPISTALTAASLMSLPFSFDQSAGDSKVDHLNGLCSKRELITNTDTMYFVGVSNAARNTSAGVIGQAFDSVSSIVTALAPLLTGAALDPNVSMKLSQVSALATPVSNLIGILDPSKSASYENGDLLREGDQTVTTPYSVVTISVKPVDAVVDDDEFRSYLETAAKTAGGSIDPGLSTDSDAVKAVKLKKSCDLTVTALAQAGFHSDKDQVFGTIYAAANKINTRRELAICLGARNAHIAAAFPDKLWLDEPGLKLDERFVGTIFPPTIVPPQDDQPSAGDTERLMDIFTAVLGRYAKDPNPNPKMLASLKHVSSGVGIDDPEFVFGTEPLPSGLSAIMQYLMGRNMHHFGFHVPGDSSMWADYGAHSGFLGIYAAAGDTHAPLSAVVAFFPIFDANGDIARFRVTDHQQSILTMLNAYHSDNGFTIDLPPATTTPATTTTTTPATTTTTTTTPQPPAPPPGN